MKRPSPALVLGTLGTLLGLAALWSLGQGAVPVPASELLAALLDHLGLGGSESPAASGTPHAARLLLELRLPRLALALVVGSALGSAGAGLQGLLRNPLADPGLLGITSGAALGAALVIVLGDPLLQRLPAWMAPHLLSLAAFAVALVLGHLVLHLGRLTGRTEVLVLLLAGLAILAISEGAVGLLTYLANDAQMRQLTFWRLGSLAGSSWVTVLAALLAVPCTLLIWRAAPALDLMLLGEREAHHLGVDVERLKRRLMLLVALGVGTTVAACGPVAFIGLLGPHAARLAFGPGHRLLLPASSLIGATVLVVLDSFARTWAAPAEIPIGILLSMAGGPLLIGLLIREARALRHGRGALS